MLKRFYLCCICHLAHVLIVKYRMLWSRWGRRNQSSVQWYLRIMCDQTWLRKKRQLNWLWSLYREGFFTNIIAVISTHPVSSASGKLRWSWPRSEKPLSSCTASPQSSFLPSQAHCHPYTDKYNVDVSNTVDSWTQSQVDDSSGCTTNIVSGDCSPLETQPWWAHLKIGTLQLHCEIFCRSSSCTPPAPAHKRVEMTLNWV